ncbi:hypothetical protein [Caballeronia humi]|uniref:Uncharacterized protein n=1 Tax=Caballeronia humi TaxID=326474 RepID=A0A158JD82_9BURK|nr:hypothetical protein [Caballeronia humi]SAL66290.1 hypothetical protein AWB65_06323 [Caballeronia humi]
MERYIGKQLAHNPLALAALYHDGLGRQWTNQRDAAAALTKLGVRREHVNRAVRVASMPVEVLSLFTEAGLLDKTARQLLSLQRTVGRDSLVQRAGAVSKEGKSWTEIIQLLTGEPVSAPKRRRPAVSQPLLRAARYTEGLANNEWSTLSEASGRTGWAKTKISEAISVSKLPAVVIELFDAKRFTTKHAADLQAIVRLLGITKVVRNAKWLTEHPGRRTSKEILKYLASGEPTPDCDVAVARKGTSVTISFTFEARPNVRKLVDVDQLKMLSISAFKNSVEVPR